MELSNKIEASNAGIYSWYLRDSQFEIYKFLYEHSNPFVECARRFGKTTTILTYCLERLRNIPRTVVRWIEPWKNQAREIIDPEITKIQELTHGHLCGVYVGTDSYYRFSNGSRLYLRGANDDKGTSARGSFAHIIVADEFGFWSYPEMVESVLQPQLLTTKGQLIIASTPPEDLGHSYYERKANAIRDGRFIQKTILENESLTKEEVEDECKKQGGPNSPSWRREYLCEPISNPERLVIPEFNEHDHTTDTIHRPLFFDSYVSMDLGLNDNTAILFAYYDFEKNLLVIEREWVNRGKNSKVITDAAKQIEYELWGDKKPYKRVADNNLQQLCDMTEITGYEVIPTSKDDKLAIVNSLRLAIGSGKVMVHKSCVNLIFQLKVGLWNERRSDFLRGDKTGHLDAIDALVYLWRNIDQYKNPMPVNYGISYATHFIPEDFEKSKESEAFKKLLNFTK